MEGKRNSAQPNPTSLSDIGSFNPKTLAQLLYREENDPDWAAADESAGFRRYEELLISLNKQVAAKYDNRMSWHALVYTNYNPGSELAEWLVHQPQAIKTFLETIRDPRDEPAGNAAELLAEALRDCDDKREMATCRQVQEQRGMILSNIRQSQQSIIWLCRRAEQRIRSRLGQQPAAKPAF